ncbi:phosphotransferase family protein [Micromonospora echinofusca]|uniref:Phosphotransferase n=1 Tax=Micromonospora echinofusca TaxID=47858 RepID=A0ABS3VYY1_MICEH|nr:aminoglycoside phosphotransferase family protein [Micromonospora echinofusca]MBO4209752.1 phosphotransferase [Micromonospora echinofusca]
MSELPHGVARLAAERGLTGLTPIGGGLEFRVFRAVTPQGTAVALRTAAGHRFQANANDPEVDTRALLTWEHTVTSHLAGHGIPVAAPRELALGDPDVSVSDFVDDDGQGPEPYRLGSLLRRLHGVPPPAARPVAHEGLPTGRLVPRRIARRWREVAARVPDLPAPPPVDRLAAAVAGRPQDRLLHLDVRAANLRCVDGRVHALLDWSNALIGDPALELGRLAEFALLPENGIDVEAVSSGYGDGVPVGSAAAWTYRLDAAVMLAVVFLSEAPDPVRGPRAVDRLREVHDRWLHRTRR